MASASAISSACGPTRLPARPRRRRTPSPLRPPQVRAPRGRPGRPPRSLHDAAAAAAPQVSSRSLRVDGFVRPFRLEEARALLEKHGALAACSRRARVLRATCHVRRAASGPHAVGRCGAGSVLKFWMDSIKSHCYATFSSVEAATAAKKALQDLKWPVLSACPALAAQRNASCAHGCAQLGSSCPALASLTRTW